MMTTAQVFSYTLPATGNTDHQTMQSGFDGESITALTSFTDIALVNDPHDMGTNIRNNNDPNLVPTNMDANHTANTTSSGLEGDSGGFRGINWTSTSTATNENQPVDTSVSGGDTEGEYMSNRVGAHLSWGSPGNPGYPRFAALKAVDTTYMDTININWFTRGLITQDLAPGSETYGQYVTRDDTDFTEPGDGIYLFYWAGDKEGAAQYAGDLNASTKDHDGWRPVNVKPDGTTDSGYSPLLIPHKAEGYKGNRFFKNDLELPPWTRDKNTRFIIVQIDNHTGIHKSRWGMTSVRFQRRAPMNVVVALDNPAASAFVRLGQGSAITDPKKRKKRVEKILKASKDYVTKAIGKDFPGTDVEIGEAQGTGSIQQQKWADTTQRFIQTGTLDQQLDKFVGDVKPAAGWDDVSDEELEWNDMNRNEKGEVIRVMPPPEEQNRRWERLPYNYKDQYGFDDGPPVGLWPPHENSIVLPATKTFVNPKTGQRYEAHNQNFGVDPNSGWVTPEPGYGDRIGTSPDRGWPAVVIDKDGDGVDDRDQVGPGQPRIIGPFPFPPDKVPPKDPIVPPPEEDPEDPWVPPVIPPRPPVDPIPPKDPIVPPPDDPKDPPKKPPIDKEPPRKYPPPRSPRDIPYLRPDEDEYDLRDPEERQRFNRDKEAFKDHIWKWINDNYDISDPKFVLNGEEDYFLNPEAEKMLRSRAMNIPYGDKEIAEVKKQIKWVYKSPDEGWTDTNGTRHQYLEPFEYNGELYYPGGEYTYSTGATASRANRDRPGAVSEWFNWIYRRSPIDGKIYSNFDDMEAQRNGKDPAEQLKYLMVHHNVMTVGGLLSPMEILNYYRNASSAAAIEPQRSMNPSPHQTFRWGEMWFQKFAKGVNEWYAKNPQYPNPLNDTPTPTPTPTPEPIVTQSDKKTSPSRERRQQLSVNEPIVRSLSTPNFKPKKKKKVGSVVNEATFDQIKRLRKHWGYKDKPSPTEDGFPEQPPAKIDPQTGFHPEYGKKAKRYGKLDPQSAESMPPTGDQEIDSTVEKQRNHKERARKIKNLVGQNKKKT